VGRRFWATVPAWGRLSSQVRNDGFYSIIAARRRDGIAFHFITYGRPRQDTLSAGKPAPSQNYFFVIKMPLFRIEIREIHWKHSPTHTPSVRPETFGAQAVFFSFLNISFPNISTFFFPFTLKIILPIHDRIYSEKATALSFNESIYP
jgi:hypothetical protein